VYACVVIAHEEEDGGQPKSGLLICRVVTLYQTKNVPEGKNHSFKVSWCFIRDVYGYVKKNRCLEIVGQIPNISAEPLKKNQDDWTNPNIF
jgi:hypothetical protein